MSASRRLAVATLAVIASLCAAVAPAGATPLRGEARTALEYGDSLAVGTGLYLPELLRGWTTTQSADVSRHADAAERGLRAYGRALPRVLVVSLGTNDDPGAVPWFRRQVESVLRVAGPNRCVIWSTILRPPYKGVSYDGYNDVLHGLARTHPSLRVFDWMRLARTNPQWFGGDGVHPTATGYRARANAIARLVRQC